MNWTGALARIETLVILMVGNSWLRLSISCCDMGDRSKQLRSFVQDVLTASLDSPTGKYSLKHFNLSQW